VLGGLAGAALGAAAGIVFELLVWSVIASAVLIVREAGLTLGGAIIGGLFGALGGMVLWNKWWHVPWPNAGAFALGVPMALVFALAGWERSRLKRKRIGKSNDSEPD
jgi:hypothetical protein